jgi:hypothetical protein
MARTFWWYTDGVHNQKIYDVTNIPENYWPGYSPNKAKLNERLIRTQTAKKQKRLLYEKKLELIEKLNDLLLKEEYILKRIKIYPEKAHKELEKFYKDNPIFEQFNGLTKPQKKKLYINSMTK